MSADTPHHQPHLDTGVHLRTTLWRSPISGRPSWPTCATTPSKLGTSRQPARCSYSSVSIVSQPSIAPTWVLLPSEAGL